MAEFVQSSKEVKHSKGRPVYASETFRPLQPHGPKATEIKAALPLPGMAPSERPTEAVAPSPDAQLIQALREF